MVARFLRWLLSFVETSAPVAPTFNITIEVNMSPALQALTDKVHANTTVLHSLLALTQGLAQQVRDLKDDPAALQALADELDANNTAIALAVTANTPAPVVPPAPVTEPAPAAPPPAATPTEPSTPAT